MYNKFTFVVFLFATLASIVPLAFHIPHRNVGVVSLCAWTTVALLLCTINIPIWDNVQNPVTLAPGYCDISARILNSANIAIASSGVVICKQLYDILRLRVPLTKAQRKKQLIVELAIIFGPWLVWQILQSVFFRNGRYGIGPVLGCYALAIPFAKPALVIFMIGPLCAATAAFYAAGVLFQLFKKRQEFRDILRSSNSGISGSRFIRLIVVCLAVLFAFVPASFQILAAYIRVAFDPRTAVPYDLSLYRQTQHLVYINYGHEVPTGWIFVLPAFGYSIALLFGTGNEALATYGRGLRSIGLGLVLDSCSNLLARLRPARVNRGFSSMLSSLDDSTSASSDMTHLKKQPASDNVELQ
ncbi:a-factor receptor [Savitreella phatthalungensis]